MSFLLYVLHVHDWFYAFADLFGLSESFEDFFDGKSAIRIS